MLADGAAGEDRTAMLYGDIWTRFTPIWKRSGARSRGYAAPARSHFELLCRAAGRDVVEGKAAIDAGCGNGTSLFEASSRHPEVELIGVDLSTGPMTVAGAADATPNVHVVQGDLLKIPLGRERFDSAMSFGVLHHTPDPEGAFRRLLDCLRPGGLITVFVYKDFTDLPFKRALLVPVTWVRRVTTRLSPRLLRSLAWIGAPLVFLGLTLPARILSRLGARELARHIPYATFADISSIAGSLEDRFGAPHEHRFSLPDLEAWARCAGLTEFKTVDCFEHGFSGLVLTGRKPGATAGATPSDETRP
jgi:SAM-dependent methyltransferase